MCRWRNFKVNVVPVSEIKLKFLYLPMYLTTNLPTYLPTYPSIHPSSVSMFEYYPRTYSKPLQYNCRISIPTTVYVSECEM